MKLLNLMILMVAAILSSFSYANRQHKMQHGFILNESDTFASHLVARGHHSRQTNIEGYLIINDDIERSFYKNRKIESEGASYFLFQAQSLDLPTLKDGDILSGHIIESLTGSYSPENVIVKKASFKVTKVLLNLDNPFFLSILKSEKETCVSKRQKTLDESLSGKKNSDLALFKRINNGKCCIWNGRPYCGKPC